MTVEITTVMCVRFGLFIFLLINPNFFINNQGCLTGNGKPMFWNTQL